MSSAQMLAALAQLRRRPLKVSISGAHSTGKSTILKRLTSEINLGQRTAYIEEIPRELIDHSGAPDYLQRQSHSPEKQLLMMGMQLQREASIAYHADLLITDRCIIDHLAYIQVLFPDYLSSFEGQQWEELAREWMKTYDLLAVTRISAPLTTDGVRENDEKFRLAAQNAIYTIIEEAPIPQLQIQGDVNEAANSIVSQIDRLATNLLATDAKE
jgi:nicotinamide riboside kinase